MLLIAAPILMGNWQLGRAHSKELLQQRIEAMQREPKASLDSLMVVPETLDYRLVVASGTWVADKTVLLDNKMHRGVPGFQVVTPLRLENSPKKNANEPDRYVLVYRGWIAAPRLRSELPKFFTPSGRVELVGVARVPRDRFIELSQVSREGAIWENLTLKRFQAWAKITVQPVVVYQSNSAETGLTKIEADGLNRDWVPADVKATKHYLIAGLWYVITAMIASVFIYVSYRKSITSKIT